jgi:hypothetical protein
LSLSLREVHKLSIKWITFWYLLFYLDYLITKVCCFVNLNQQKHFIIPENDLETGELIKRGYYGDVFKGVWKGRGGHSPVAIKNVFFPHITLASTTPPHHHTICINSIPHAENYLIIFQSLLQKTNKQSWTFARNWKQWHHSDSNTYAKFMEGVSSMKKKFGWFWN